MPRSSLRLLSASIAIFAVGAIAGGVVAQQASRFPDVEAGTEAGNAIGRFSLLGIIQGYQNGFFGPNDALTRAQAALLFARMESRMIAPLRAQIEEVRKTLDLGNCGDGAVQTGEECDDGNGADEDGCSGACLKEKVTEPSGCSDGHDFGESFPSSDGCNTCICTRDGIACTKMACLPEEEPVEPEPEPQPEPAPTEPEVPPSNQAPLCGNGICEIYENVLPPHRRYHCPMDCTGEPYQRQCEEKKTSVLSLTNNETSCSNNSDCIILSQSCPHITCGIAINKSSYPSLSLALDDALDTCRREGTVMECVLCVNSVAVCKQGQCVLQAK